LSPWHLAKKTKEEKPMKDRSLSPEQAEMLTELAKQQSAARKPRSKPPKMETKPEFAELTDMSEEQMFNNLKAALIKSGFTITKAKPHTNIKD
jgi:hypothetical protein